MHGAEGLFIDRAGSLQERARPGEAPRARNRLARLQSAAAVSGCSGPSAVSLDVFEERLCCHVVA
jgi:hypothetical protein